MSRKIILIIFIFLFAHFFLFGESKLNQVTIWDTLNAWKVADPVMGNMGSYEESILLFSEHEFLKNCSTEIKAIVAYYLKYIPYYTTAEQKLEMAKALGNYSSLSEAQQILLQNKEHYFAEIKRDEYFWIDYLVVTIDGNKILVKIGNLEQDEYLLKNNGEIIFIKTFIL